MIKKKINKKKNQIIQQKKKEINAENQSFENKKKKLKN